VDTAVDDGLSIGVVSRETAATGFVNSLYAQLVDTAACRSEGVLDGAAVGGLAA
jgi:hypothetical protein